MTKENIDELRSKLVNKTAQEVVSQVLNEFTSQKVVLASSLSVEDQVLTHMLLAHSREARIFTLDTGRLFEETYATMGRSMERYGFRYETYAPECSELEELINEYGPNPFYKSVELRKRCCEVRKLKPLARVLSTADVWICGLRREQAVTRSAIDVVEWDSNHGLIKINPLYEWTESDVWEYVRQNDIPYSSLQDKGFRSIGCAPCTRAIDSTDDIRAGRWWWEEPEHKECGLHKRGK
ncbi:phosphoadenylyl-sulfate reductase [Cellulosispirillum alkaliphilum]|uniref:phosphoadenylyl-sulfate reductase n=1 Tax=Cellulosispirillum alkaliphilum TaxID=3039283 RepID=UPI003D6FD35B